MPQARGFELLISKALKRLEPSGLCKNGRVKTSVARAMLYCLAQERVIELGSVHVASLMDAADPNDRGMVNCTRFAFLAAKMIGAYFDSSDELSNSPLRRRESMIKKSRSW